MMENVLLKSLTAILILACVAIPASADMEFIQIGDVGNAGDVVPLYGYEKRSFGAVDYAYSMGKFEVTAGQYAQFLNATAASNAHGQYSPLMVGSGQITQNGTSGSFTYTVNSAYENRPMGNLNWVSAARYCNWLTTGDTEIGVYEFEADGSFRWFDPTHSINYDLKTGSEPAYWIPSSDEYYKAAYYDAETQSYYDFATSSDATPTAGDFASANSGNWRDGGVLVDGTYSFTEVGAFENTASPYGCMDMLGNVWEWSEDFVWGGWVNDVHVYGPMYHGGSFWSSTPLYSNTNYYSGYVGTSVTDTQNFDMGLRIASNVPEPMTLGLLSIGGLALLRRKK